MSDIDCTTWSEEEAIRRAAHHGDMDGIAYLTFQRMKRLEREVENITAVLIEANIWQPVREAEEKTEKIEILKTLATALGIADHVKG